MRRIPPDTSKFDVHVAGIIIHEGYLLLSRSSFGDEVFWHLPGGGDVQLNEDSQTALVRQIQEAIGMTVAVERLLFIMEHVFVHHQRHDFTLYFLIQFPPDSQILDKSSSFPHKNHRLRATFQWVRLEQLGAIKIYPEFLAAKLSNIPDFTEHIVELHTEQNSPFFPGSYYQFLSPLSLESCYEKLLAAQLNNLPDSNEIILHLHDAEQIHFTLTVSHTGFFTKNTHTILTVWLIKNDQSTRAEFKVENRGNTQFDFLAIAGGAVIVLFTFIVFTLSAGLATCLASTIAFLVLNVIVGQQKEALAIQRLKKLLDVPDEIVPIVTGTRIARQ